MIKNIGVKTASGRTNLDKYSINWQEWKKGLTKPVYMFDNWVYRVTIKYHSEEKDFHIVKDFSTMGYIPKVMARIFRNDCIISCDLSGFEIDECNIKLVRV